MDHDDKPKGTLTILLIYLGILLVCWFVVYLIMLSRGGV